MSVLRGTKSEISNEEDVKTSVFGRKASRRAVMAGSAAASAAALVAKGTGSVAASSAGSRKSLTSRAQDGNTLTYALGFDVDGTLDPQVTNFDSTIRAILNVCEPLVWMPDGTTFVPALADSWEISEDGLEYTFHLKQGVTFHDGTPFNAQAVQYTFDRVVALNRFTADAVAQGTPADAVVPPDDAKIITPGQCYIQVGDRYDHTEIIDDNTAKIVLNAPFAPFLANINGYLGIVSPTAVETMGLAEFARKPVGTGPFMVQEWVEADHITLVKNPNYNWGSSFFKNPGASQLDSIVYKMIADAPTRTGTLISGEVQYSDDIDALQLEDLQGNDELQVIQQGQPGSGWTMLFNQQRPGKPQMEVEVRQALSFAVDKQAFCDAVFGVSAVPAASPLMKPTFAYEPMTETIYTYDTAKAASILDAAGWTLNGDIREKNGQQLSLYAPIQDRPRDKDMMTFLQGAWKAIGADLQIETMERAAASEKTISGDYDIHGLWFSYADPDILYGMFQSDNNGGFNYALYSDPEVDQWLTDAGASVDPEVRKSLYSKVQLKVVGDAIVLPLADSITLNAKSKKLQGDFLDYLASYVWMNDAHFE